MAAQPGGSQRFRFWFPYWTGAAPQRRPSVPRPPTSTPLQTSSQPQPQPKPPSPSQADSQSQPALRPQPQSPSPTTRRAPQTPSPSPVSSPSRRSSKQSQSPSRAASEAPLPSQTETKTQSPTPTASSSTSRDATKPQPATRGVTPAPSISVLPPIQTESTQPATPKPELVPQQPEPRDNGEPKPSSPRSLEPQTTTQAPAQGPEKTLIKMEAPSQPTQDPEPIQKPAATPEITAAAQQPKPSMESEETKRGTPQTSLEAKQLAQPPELPQEEQKPSKVSTEPKPEPEVKQTMTPIPHPESKKVDDEIRNDKPNMKSETQQAIKSPSSITGEPKKRMDNSSPTRSDSDVSELMTEMTISRPRQTNKQARAMQNGNSGQQRDIAISPIPQATHPKGEQGNFQTELQVGFSKLTQKLNIGRQLPGNGNAVNIITLAGENKGASMVIGYETSDREDTVHIQRHHKLNTDIGTNNNGGRKEKQVHIDHENEAKNANINSNMQSINNSILQESSCNERDPGVHLIFSSKPIEDIKIEEKPEARETLKTTSSTSPAQKMTYEPNIRRRCLRGLFLESSEDDQENPQKPRRHGCRFSCDEKKKGRVDVDGTTTTHNTKHTEVGTSRK